MIRDRTTLIPSATASWSVTPNGGATCGPGSSVLASYNSMYEYIEESDRGRRNDNDCYHIKQTVDMPRTSFDYAVSATASPSVYCKYTTNDQQFRWNIHQGPGLDSGQYGILGTKGLDSFSVIGNSEIDQAKEDGLINMWPRIRAEVLSLNSLYELKDFKRLPDLLRRISSVFAQTPKWVRALAAGSRAPIREAFRLGSEAYLSNEFAIRPLLADITGVFDALMSFKKQLRKLQEEQGKRRTIYYSRPLTTLFPELDENYLLPVAFYYNGIRFYRKVERIWDPIFRCSMDYSFVIPAMSQEELEVKALLDSLGVNLNPQIIWNALPWSFVIDWFVGVNRWLGNTRMNNIEPDVTIYRYNWSVKAARRITCKTKYAEGGPFSPTVTNRTSEEYYYYRSTRMPDWAAYVKTSGLNLKEFSYIGALIGARQ